MYKVLLVDDEYMITEGLKKLIPFEKWVCLVDHTRQDELVLRLAQAAQC